MTRQINSAQHSEKSRRLKDKPTNTKRKMNRRISGWTMCQIWKMKMNLMAEGTIAGC